MRKIMLVALALAAALSLAPRGAQACNCAAPRTAAEAMAQSAIVSSGRLAGAQQDLTRPGPGVEAGEAHEQQLEALVVEQQPQPARDEGMGWMPIIGSLLGLLVIGVAIGAFLGRRAGRKKE